MPEMPELQALTERLAETYAGKRFAAADVLGFSALKTFEVQPGELAGRTLESTGRRGKYLILGAGDLKVLIHLSQGGRIDIEQPPKTTKPRGAVVRLRFEDGPSLLVKEFGTERKAAWWVLHADDCGPLEGLGPEPFDGEFEELIRTGDDRRQLHTMLRDQRTVAGIGRGFADDILHEARLSPYTPLAKLDDEERERLLLATRGVLEAATDRERAREGGLPAKMGDRFTIHNRTGEPCPRCGDTLHRVSYESREVVYCPNCQTGGKILADRRMSKLLK